MFSLFSWSLLQIQSDTLWSNDCSFGHYLLCLHSSVYTKKKYIFRVGRNIFCFEWRWDGVHWKWQKEWGIATKFIAGSLSLSQILTSFMAMQATGTILFAIVYKFRFYAQYICSSYWFVHISLFGYRQMISPDYRSKEKNFTKMQEKTSFAMTLFTCFFAAIEESIGKLPLKKTMGRR